MPKHTIEVACPGCKQNFSAEVELPESKPQEVKLDPAAIAQEVAASFKAEEKAKHFTEALAELEAWRTGRNHSTFDPARAEACPDCGPILRAYVDKKVQAGLDTLQGDKEKVKELAKRHGLWPPPSFVLNRKLRR